MSVLFDTGCYLTQIGVHVRQCKKVFCLVHVSMALALSPFGCN